MVDRRFGKAEATHGHQRRQKAVQTGKQRHVSHTLSLEYASRAANVSDRFAGGQVAETISDAGGDFADEVIVAAAAVSVYHIHIRRVEQLFGEHGNVCRVVLSVAIQGSDHITFARLKTRPKGR